MVLLTTQQPELVDMGTTALSFHLSLPENAAALGEPLDSDGFVRSFQKHFGGMNFALPASGSEGKELVATGS